MGLGKFTMRCDQGATFHVQGRWRTPLIDLNSGDPVLDFEGNLQAGQPVSLYGYTGRMHVRKTIAATEFDLELTTANNGVRIPQTVAFLIGWCRLATEANHPLTGLAPVDGVTPVAGDRILVKSQDDDTTNGVYVAATGAWARAPDADQASDISEGCCVWVREGVRYDDTTWRQQQALSDLGDGQLWLRNEDIGIFEVYATPEQTAALQTSGVYDVEMISPGPTGEVTRVLEGKFRLSKEVTRT
jgi:hypothetical protein